MSQSKVRRCFRQAPSPSRSEGERMNFSASGGNVNGECCRYWYHSSMHPDYNDRRRLTPLGRAAIEVVFIVFLFYSNLLMGEFTATNGPGKTLAFALNDIFSGMNFLIAVISALIGYVVFEYLRMKL